MRTKHTFIFLSLSILLFSCTKLIRNNYITSKENPTDEECSYETGFKDSYHELEQRNLCVYKNDSYTSGYRNGLSYLIRLEMIKSLNSKIQNRKNDIKSLIISSNTLTINNSLYLDLLSEIKSMESEKMDLAVELSKLNPTNAGDITYEK